ncbi:MAG: helix-hairpin-helix domain-containing protein [Bacteroidota bacterium]|nr:MAG: helix-hairpin-helix domain-containing protein [Bacteroidota bacterium]
MLGKIKPYFEFTPQEQRGMVVLIILIFLSVLLKIFWPVFQTAEEEPMVITIEQIKPDSEQEVPSGIAQKKNEWTKESTAPNIQFKGKLDPNSATQAELTQLGFSEFSARNVEKYRKRGGRFESEADLMKIYGVDSSFVVLARNYLVYPAPETIQTKKTASLSKIEINNALSIELEKIPCIGPTLSERILLYRDKLGGFYAQDQLKEVYGIDSSCYSNLKEYISIDTSLIRKINLNKSTEKELDLHPYITTYQAKGIVKFRELDGPITRPETLVDNRILSSRQLDKLRVYLNW